MKHELGGEDIYVESTQARVKEAVASSALSQGVASCPLPILPLFYREWVFFTEFLSMIELQ